MACQKELNAVMGSNQFRSQHQAWAIELSSRHKSDLLMALGAQGGALLLFMLCGVNEKEEKLTTVIAVPSPLWLSSLRAQLNKVRITVREWKTGVKKMDSRPSVLLVLTATTATPEFRLFFFELCWQRVIARLLFDQIHLFLSPLLVNLLPTFNLHEKLPEGLVPFVGTSPALAQDVVTNLVMHKLHFRPGSTQLVQDKQLLHPNIYYSAF